MTVRINEYYDLFDIHIEQNPNYDPTADPPTEPEYLVSLDHTDDLPDDIRSTNQTNPFSGVSNWGQYNPQLISTFSTFDSANPNNNVVITGKHKAPQAINQLTVDENGDIWCFPPGNASVPYWNKIIFRNFDYMFNPLNLTKTDPGYSYQTIMDAVYINHLTGENNQTPKIKYIFNNKDYSETPLFLKFDRYPSRSKVIFSSCDKTRNPDIEFSFNGEQNSMEPIKLNLSLSASQPSTDLTTPTTKYNPNLSRAEIENLLTKCYWCIEWIYEKRSGN